ncbi:MAG: hypothetical protein Q8J78_17210 [Moraxellaceae bacterium]|nr:hypothetical protein [Moraxellaceae bacterium]
MDAETHAGLIKRYFRKLAFYSASTALIAIFFGVLGAYSYRDGWFDYSYLLLLVPYSALVARNDINKAQQESAGATEQDHVSTLDAVANGTFSVMLAAAALFTLIATLNRYWLAQ